MSTTKAREIALELNCREYGEEMNGNVGQIAEMNGLIIIYGASDDIINISGAIDDEISEGKFIVIPAGETVEIYDEEEEKTWVEGRKDRAMVMQLRDEATERKNLVTGEYGEDGVWRFVTNVPHNTFNIHEEGRLFCVGIVIDLNDVRKNPLPEGFIFRTTKADDKSVMTVGIMVDEGEDTEETKYVTLTLEEMIEAGAVNGEALTVLALGKAGEEPKFITQDAYDELTDLEQWQYLANFPRKDLVTIKLDNDATYFELEGYEEASERGEEQGYILSPGDYIGNGYGAEMLLKALGFKAEGV